MRLLGRVLGCVRRLRGHPSGDRLFQRRHPLEKPLSSNAGGIFLAINDCLNWRLHSAKLQLVETFASTDPLRPTISVMQHRLNTATKYEHQYKRLNRLLASNDMGLLTQHEVGQVIQQMHPVKKREKYGNNALIVLAAKIRNSIPQAKYSANRLYSLREFALKFSVAELKALIRLAKQHQAKLSWSHILYSLPIESSSQRLKTLQQVIRSRGTADDLMRLKLSQSGVRKSLGGQKLHVPQTLQQTLEQIVEHTEGWLNRCQQVWLHEESPLYKCPRSPKPQIQKNRSLAKHGLSLLKRSREIMLEAMHQLKSV